MIATQQTQQTLIGPADDAHRLARQHARRFGLAFTGWQTSPGLFGSVDHAVFLDDKGRMTYRTGDQLAAAALSGRGAL